MITLLFYDNELNLVPQAKISINELDELFDERFSNYKLEFDDVETIIGKTSLFILR